MKKKLDITILYEDDNYLVINKPTGLVVHADGKTNEKTLVDWILSKYPEIKDVGEPLTLTSHFCFSFCMLNLCLAYVYLLIFFLLLLVSS